MWHQKTVTLPSTGRGFHIITDNVCAELPELAQVKTGLLHIFLKHTSASLMINEHAAKEVRDDLEVFYHRLVPEDEAFYKHTEEGIDDMPAHIKASMLGCEVTVPVADGKLLLGTWQGIFLCEHRYAAPARTIVLTLQGAS